MHLIATGIFGCNDEPLPKNARGPYGEKNAGNKREPAD